MKSKKIIICMLIVIMLMQQVCMASVVTVEDGPIEVSEEQFNTIQNGVSTGKVSQGGGSAGVAIIKFFSYPLIALYSLCGMVLENPTIEGMCFTTDSILSIDFFSYSEYDEDTLQYKIGKNIATWYTNLRNLSVGALLCVLVYIGIRMTLASTRRPGSKI